MNRRLRSLTDEELAEHCKHRRWEMEVKRIGCWLMFFSVFVSIFACLAVDRGPVWLEIPVGVVLFPIILSILADAIASARPRPYMKELKRRYGQLEFDAEIAEAKNRLSEPSPPDWILLLRGISESTGKYYAMVRIHLFGKADVTSRLEVLTGPETGSLDAFTARLADGGTTGLARATAELRTEGAKDLMQFLGQLNPDTLLDVESTIGKAYPCSIAAIRREPPAVLRGACDLLGTSEADANQPTALLVRRIMALAEQVSWSSMIQGWGEYAGDSRTLYSKAPFEIQYSPEREEQTANTDWVIKITLSEATDPPDKTQRIRVELTETNPPAGSVIVQNEAFRYEPANPRERAKRTGRSLRADEAESLLTRLRQLRPDALASIPSTSDSGVECRIQVLRREPRWMPSRCFAVNDLIIDQRKHPAMELVLELLRIADEDA